MPVSFRKSDLENTEPRICHSGKLGSAEWTIDEDGLLVIGEGTVNTDELPPSRHEDEDTSDRWPWYPWRKEIDRVDGSAPLKVIGDLSYAFGGAERATVSKRGIYTSIESIDLSGWDTSEVTSMRSLFFDCSGMTELNIDGFQTGNVRDMANMFNGCYSLHELNVQSFDTRSVEDMSGMFTSCYLLESLDVSGFDTTNVRNMESMFAFCHRLGGLDVSHFDTSKCEDMGFMFSGDRALQSLDLSGFDTRHVTNMDFMFSECSSIQSLNLESFDTANALSLFKMFNDAYQLQRLNITHFQTQNARFIQKMFDGCKALSVVGFGSGVQNTLKAFRSRFPKGEWYLNNEGPFALLKLPALEEGQTGWLTRTKQMSDAFKDF